MEPVYSLPEAYVLVQADELSSTNAWMRERLKQGLLSDKTVVIANHQTSGKGQGSNVWYDTPGESLLISVYYRNLAFSQGNLFYLNMAASLALWFGLRPYLDDGLQIKWPNDLMQSERKLAGILIENQWQGSRLEHSILGFGVNLLQKCFPDELPLATSVLMETGKAIDPLELLPVLCRHLQRILELTGSDAGKKWLEDNYHQSLWRMNRELAFRNGPNRFHGVLEGVNPDGGLRLVTNGRQQTFYHGEIKLITS